ncbi:hypothetical protein Pla110_38650 [Polystyrenella longa]|uniref:FecR protein n=1 Tax=Polystyrenella longa TaxID=2528007 RepID=A0A518CSB6_9PLAN|nr:LamG domain-containing protein [Polystyrenella longa]QDU82110.1 hypothetical protein Pla110_38650 [Polystyrenella longa]
MAVADNEFQELLDLLCDGDLDAAQQQRLAELLENSPERQREYLQYLDLHARMQAEQSSELPAIKSVTLKQMTVEFEDSANSSSTSTLGQFTRRIEGERVSSPRRWLIFLIPVVIGLIGALWFFNSTREEQVVATVHSSQLETPLAAWQPGVKLNRGKHQLPAGEVTIELSNRTLLTVNGPIEFELPARGMMFIEQGMPQVQATTAQDIFELTYGNIRFISREADFEISKSEESGAVELKVTSGEVEVRPRLWQPQHYWNFDETDRQVRDQFGDADGQLSRGTSRVAGLIGTGAVEFDNTSEAGIAVGSGGGQALGTGTFAVDDGITLEALIVPRWEGNGFSTGDKSDYDEIIRKDGDGELRFLLSFQNDDPMLNEYSNPKQPAGPVLAFGLYLIGQGYQELEIPLAGENATVLLSELKDGEPHHIAATYETASGRKQVYVDGRLVASYQYPHGTRPLTGGPGEVVIGNLSPPGEEAREPFHGIIDEVAFYNFALPAAEVESHFQAVQEGLQSYFGKKLPYRYRVSAGSILLLDPATGLQRQKLPAPE